MSRITRLGITLAVVWACACGYGPGNHIPYRAEVSILNLSQAGAAGGEQVYADELCDSLQTAYGGTQKGVTLEFKHCAPARYSQTAASEIYWVWFTVKHGHRVAYALGQVDDTGYPVGKFLRLTRGEFRGRWHPSTKYAA